MHTPGVGIHKILQSSSNLILQHMEVDKDEKESLVVSNVLHLLHFLTLGMALTIKQQC